MEGEPIGALGEGRRGLPTLALRHRARASELRAIRRRVGSWAVGNALCADVVIDLQLALGEAVSNGVEHAYPEGEPGTVDVELEIRPSGRGDGRVVAVRVVDHGTWRPVPATPGHRGRGLVLIGRLSHGLRVCCTRDGTEVRLDIPVPA